MAAQENIQTTNNKYREGEAKGTKELLILCIADTEGVSGTSICGQGNRLGGKIDLVRPGVDECIGLLNRVLTLRVEFCSFATNVVYERRS